MNDVRDLLDRDALDQAAALERGEVSPTELVDAAIARVQARNPGINAVIHERFEAARAEAAAVTPGSAPFAGVPFLVKDLGCAMAGEPHHMGTRVLRDLGYRAEVDAYLYRRFRQAGFVALGRTNTPELGGTITTEPLAYGPTLNPWDRSRSAGGSSGGAAASVAAGMVAVAHANDGGGSIRVPAANCGLVGLKPSRGRISQGPEAGESWAGATTDGVVTRSVRDTAAVLDLICGPEVGDPYSAAPLARPLAEEVGADPGVLRVGLLDHPVLAPEQGSAECAEAVARAGALLESLGHHVEPAWPAALEDPEFSRRFLVVVAVGTAFEVARLTDIAGRELGEHDLEPDTLMLASIGRGISGADYLAAVGGQHSWSRRMLSWWDGGPSVEAGGGFDLLVSPVIAKPPPPVGYLAGPGSGARLMEYFQYTAQFNVTGQPAVSLPLHRDGEGVPVGVQLVAPALREDLLIRVASQLESAAPWPTLAP